MLLPLFDNLREMLDANYQDRIFPEIENIHAYDFKQAYQFLLSYRGSEATFNAYRREIERFLQWCQHIACKNLNQISQTDCEQYIAFCQSPPKNWISLKKVPRFVIKNGQRVPNQEWRPFVVTIPKLRTQQGITATINEYNLSEKALTDIFAILGSFYQYLLAQQYVKLNPIAQIRQKSKFIRKQHGKTKIRRLSELQWSYIIETAELMAHKEPEIHERTLFIMNALYGMYLRISELAASERWVPEMGDFQRDQDGNWWFITVGKGNKQRQISVSDAMLEALKRYRKYLGLSLYPTPGERTPLLSRNKGYGPITSTRHIREIVQTCFDETVKRIKKEGLEEEAEQVAIATVHWLRHTGISEDVKIRPREHVRDDAGHSSSAITDKYIDIELRERHASARKKKIKPACLEEQ